MFGAVEVDIMQTEETATVEIQTVQYEDASVEVETVQDEENSATVEVHTEEIDQAETAFELQEVVASSPVKKTKMISELVCVVEPKTRIAKAKKGTRRGRKR